MRSTFIILFVLLNATFISKLQAQEKPSRTPEERATALTEWMKSNLQLTSDQEGMVQSINLKYANMNQEISNSSQSRMQKFKALKSNDQSKDGELKGVFTDEQFKIYESKKEELRKKFKEEMKERKGGS